MHTQVQTKQELIHLIHQNADQILALGVISLGIFGSFVRDSASASSDVDFLIEFDPVKKNLKNLIELGDFLETITRRNVELVTPQSLSKHIGPYILKEVEYVSLAA
jgi:predicted nucleotidyltransferase